MLEKHFPHLSSATFHILLALRDGELHGYEIIKRVSDDSERRVTLLTGTLYNSLKRLLSDKLITETGSDARRRYYKLTKSGRMLVNTELERYQNIVTLLKNTNEGGIVHV